MSEITLALRVLFLSLSVMLAVQVRSQDAPVALTRNWSGWTLNTGLGVAVIGHGIKPQNRIIGMRAVPEDQFAYVGARAELQLMRHLGPGILVGAGVNYMHTSPELINGGLRPVYPETRVATLYFRGVRGVGIVEVPFFRSNQLSTSGVLSMGLQKLDGVLPGSVDNPNLYGALAIRISIAKKYGNMLFFELNVEQSTFESNYHGIIIDNRIIATSFKVGYRLGRLMLKPN